MPTPTASSAQRIAGVVLISANLLSLAVVLHHPHASSHGSSDWLAGLQRISGVNRAVHGAMMIKSGTNKDAAQ